MASSLARARAPLALAIVLLVGASFLQRPGKLTFDTKLDMVVAPARFLARALHLWDPSASFGQIQNQAVGYLFPMGPWFVAADALSVPMWMAQRGWIALLLVVGMVGMVRLAAGLDVGSPGARVVGALGYVLAPSVTGQIGSTSGAVIATMLVPWAILPLIGAADGGSPRRGAARSGLAILAMGGINATCTLAVLPLPLLYLLTRPPSRRRRRLVMWWLASAALACAWWLGALLLQGRWGFDFVAYTETAAITESTTSALEALRGAGAWLYYLNLQGPWLPGGWILVTSGVAILATSVVAAAGMAGLVSARLPEKPFLLGSFALGVLLVTAGYGGLAAGIADDAVRALLGGGLAPFRNVSKFEPLLRLPLAIGLVVALEQLSVATGLSGGRRAVARLLSAVMLAAVVGCGLPFLADKATLDRPFEAVPSYWAATAGWLDRHAGDTTALLVPASPFADYTWGRAADEPMQPLSRSRWAVRSLIPLGGLGSTRLLDGVEARLTAGRPSRGLRPVLARSGVGYVVARNDLDWRRAGAPEPTVVHAALVAAGLRRVASFGPTVPRSGADPAAGAAAAGSPGLPAIEVFAVPLPAGRVTAPLLKNATTVSGGAESLLQLADRDLLGPGAAILSGDLPSGLQPPRRTTVTDTAPRRATDFGLIRDNASYVLSPGELAAGQSQTKQLLEGVAKREQPVVLDDGVARATASSYGSWLVQLPELAPSRAFDQDPSTAWVPGGAEGSQGEWVQATFDRRRDVRAMTISLLRDGPWRPRVGRVRVTTSEGSVETRLQPTDRPQAVDAPPGRATFVRLTLEEVVGETASGAPPGVAEISIPGLRISRRILVRAAGPPRGPGSRPAYSLRRSAANPFTSLRRDEEPELDRLIRVPRASRLRLTGTVVPVAGRPLDRLITFPRGVGVDGTSSWNGLPRWQVANAVDTSTRTEWIAATPAALGARAPATAGLAPLASGASRPPGDSPVPVLSDAAPRIRLSWVGPRTLGAVRIRPARRFAAPPTRVRITSTAGTRELDVDPDGLMRFAPLRSIRSVTVSFPGVANVRGTNADGGRSRLPVGLADLDFPALRDVRPVAPPPATKVDRSCGEGPDVEVDGRPVRTRLRTTVAAIVSLDAVPFEVCGASATMRLAAGAHTVRARVNTSFAVLDVELRPRRRAWRAVARSRAVEVVRWDDTRGSARVAAGPTALLTLPQNYNEGWQAALDGRQIAPIRVDGWQQGFVLPRGGAGVVQMRFAPDSAFRWALLVGAVLAAALLPLALVGRRRGAGAPVPPGAEAPVRRLSGTAGLPLRTAAAAVVVALVSWPATVAVPLLLLAARAGLRPLVLVIAPGGMLAAGVVGALHADPNPVHEAGAFGLTAQVLASVAFAAVLVAAWVDREDEAT